MNFLFAFQMIPMHTQKFKEKVDKFLLYKNAKTYSNFFQSGKEYFNTEKGQLSFTKSLQYQDKITWNFNKEPADSEKTLTFYLLYDSDKSTHECIWYYFTCYLLKFLS